MKKFILISLIIMSSLASCVQIDAVNGDEYREVTATPGLLTNRVIIEQNYGDGQIFLRNKRSKAKRKLQKFNYAIIALNLMGNGWVFVYAFPVTMGVTQNYHHGLRKPL